MLFCVIIVTGYRSSLIAHLTVQARSKPIETFEELLSQHNWKWGMEGWLIQGIDPELFTRHPYFALPLIYKEMEVCTIKNFCVQTIF